MPKGGSRLREHGKEEKTSERRSVFPCSEKGVFDSVGKNEETNWTGSIRAGEGKAAKKGKKKECKRFSVERKHRSNNRARVA